jgi:hypothetical protein
MLVALVALAAAIPVAQSRAFLAGSAEQDPSATQRVVFSRGWRLFVVGVNGGRARPLTNESGVIDGGASWAPDGQEVAFGRTVLQPQAQH